jgi:hypothetical protein
MASWLEHKVACGTSPHAYSSHALQSSVEMNKLMHDQLETKLQEVDGMLSTIKISFSSEARNAFIISKKRDAVRQLADMKPLMEHLLHQQHQLLHQLADKDTEHSA